MKVLFRTDASLQIGTGHVMRCLTLAKALRGKGAGCRFICREHPGNLIDYIQQQGFEVVALPMPNDQQPTGAKAEVADLAHATWLGCDWATDAAQTRVGADGTAIDWLVIDHYALDARWENALRFTAKKIMVIDDLADRQHDCDVLLDQNYYVDMQMRYVGKVPEHCRLMLGPRYALLRDEFRKLRAQVKPRTGKVGRILLFFGGVDPDNHTGVAIDALAELGIEGIAVDVVIGAQHPHRSDIEKFCATLGYVCHVQTSRMAELMAEADLAIGAGGTATWERCSLGLPALSICIAENQRRQLVDAAAAALLYAPLTGEALKNILRVHVRALIENPALRELISKSAMQAVDGRGVMRVVRLLDGSEVDIRLAAEDDSLKLFEWRNHLSIRRVSRNPQPIAWEAHQAWFAATLSNQDRILLIGSMGGQAVGVVRFDVFENEAEVSIYLVPEGGFAGQGRNLLLSAERWLIRHHPSIKRLHASALEGNEASHCLFRGLGYQIEAFNYSKELHS